MENDREKQLERDKYFETTHTGTKMCIEEAALERLLHDGILFCSERVCMWNGKPNGSSIVLYVNCNDLFYCATADAEALPMSEIGHLLDLHLQNYHLGAAKWCCIHRKLRPKDQIVEKMKVAGIWDDEMEQLPAPNVI